MIRISSQPSVDLVQEHTSQEKDGTVVTYICFVRNKEILIKRIPYVLNF